MELAHTKTYDEVASFFGVDTERGLSDDQVKRNQDKYGLNGNYILLNDKYLIYLIFIHFLLYYRTTC